MIEAEISGKHELQGIAVSPGIVIGKAHLVDRSKVKILYQYVVSDEEVSSEVERFQDALRVTEEQLVTLKNRIPDHVKEHSFILDSCLMMLKDSMIRDATVQRILEERINAEWALKKALKNIRQIFDQIDDEYISTRIIDVENVTEKILRNLSGETEESLGEINERVIIVAHDLSPADTAELNINKVLGFITEVGGPTSHTAIMAQALQLPAVVGLEDATGLIEEGDLLIIDGTTGKIIVKPDDQSISHYQEKHLQHEEYKSTIIRTSHLPAVTLDGHKTDVKANIEFVEEARAVKEYGGEGIGLYRTEFLYLRSKGLPGEEELFKEYKEVVEMTAPAPVTIRTLDLGGDKFFSGLSVNRETNPALGLRAIRFCLREPDMFKSQLRAIFRASVFGKVRLMFPMISGLQEVLDAKEIVEEIRQDLDRERIAYDPDIKIGIMIEIPSAVTMSDVLAEHVDFFSIGTNDLIQYALAIDRGNEHVAHMYQPFHPAILKMIEQIVNAARQADISISVCGEMGGDPFCVPSLVGMGIDELSVNPTSIPLIKHIIRSISFESARDDFENVIRLSTAREVRAYILERMKVLEPLLEEQGFLLPDKDRLQ